MEISIGDYGRMMFEMVAAEKGEDMSDHWKSIKEKAQPLVQQLIALNQYLGYEIVGQLEGKKRKLSKLDRIREAQKKLWGVKAGKCKIGDLVWEIEEHDMIVGTNDPCLVEFKKQDCIIIEVPHMGGEHLEKIFDPDVVLRAPKDWKENEELYSSDEYWLGKADELNI